MMLMRSDHLWSSDIVTLGILQMGHFQVQCFALGHMNGLAFDGIKAHVPELFLVF